jgi:tRNA threonylcarbamoyladenosine biosynthesis protein TsaB
MSRKEPLILALDTATGCCALALTTGTMGNGGVLASLSLNSGITHSRKLIASIDWLFGETEVDWAMIHGVTVGLGPGSFTGLRIGMATAKGLAAAAGKPLIGISTLDVLANNCMTTKIICAVLDARKREVYFAFYRRDDRHMVRRISAIQAIDPSKLIAEINEPVLMVGDGVLTYGEVWQDILGDRIEFAPVSLHFPSAVVLGLLGGKALERNQCLDLATAVPLYVRASDAELNLEMKNRHLFGEGA